MFRNRMFDIVDNMLTYIVYHIARNLFILSKYITDLLEGYRHDRGYMDNVQFDKKYEERDFYKMALEIPMGIPLTLPSIWQEFPDLSKNHVYKVIEIKKRLLDEKKASPYKIYRY